MRHWVALSLIIGLAAGCQTLPSSQGAAPTGLQAHERVVVSGRVVYERFGIKATSAAVVANASVMLLDDTGVARYAGVTDSSGVFRLVKGTGVWEPADGKVYTLRIIKRVGGTGKNPLSLSTLILRRDGLWTSISGKAITINLTTSAVAQLVKDDAAIQAADVMDTVSGAEATTVGAIGGHPAEAMTVRIERLRKILDLDVDTISDRAFVVPTCDPACKAFDLSGLKEVDEIQGDLIIESKLITQVKLPNLRAITGKLVIQNSPNLRVIDMGNLTKAGGIGFDPATVPLLDPCFVDDLKAQTAGKWPKGGCVAKPVPGGGGTGAIKKQNERVVAMQAEIDKQRDGGKIDQATATALTATVAAAKAELPKLLDRYTTAETQLKDGTITKAAAQTSFDEVDGDTFDHQVKLDDVAAKLGI